MPLIENYIAGLLRYTDFKGRSERAEYWWFTFANLIHASVFWLLGGLGGPIRSLSLLYALAVLVPNLAVTVRRLHDTGRSAWWLPFAVLPTPLVFLILFFMCLPSEAADNKYGPASSL